MRVVHSDHIPHSAAAYRLPLCGYIVRILLIENFDQVYIKLICSCRIYFPKWMPYYQQINLLIVNYGKFVSYFLTSNNYYDFDIVIKHVIMYFIFLLFYPSMIYNNQLTIFNVLMN